MNLRPTIRQVMGFYLALALLMVPLMGLMHGIVHDFSHGLPTAVVKASAQPYSHGHQDEHKGWSDGLFASHETAADCLVFDQLCHADAVYFMPPAALPLMLSSLVLVTLAGDFIARRAALYQARGPPSAR
jgi:hypothetical protein